MNAFLAGDIDAAQAMTYNEYAQVLETVNPETGELYQPEDLNVIDWNEVGTAMLQDAIWASTDRLEERGLRRPDRGLHQGVDQAAGSTSATTREEAAEIVTAAGSQLGASHQLWMTNEVNKLIWPSTNGVGMIDQGAWDQTVEIATGHRERDRRDDHQRGAAGERVHQRVRRAGPGELRDEGVDVEGEDFEPIEVTLNEGGN